MEIQNQPQVTVLHFAGRIVHGDGADTLRQTVMSQDGRHIQIDLSEVEKIDASGLGVLVSLEKWAKEKDRTLQIVSPSKYVLEAIQTTNLTSVLKICTVLQKSNHAA